LKFIVKKKKMYYLAKSLQAIHHVGKWLRWVGPNGRMLQLPYGEEEVTDMVTKCCLVTDQ
jgi:hypothetical protein